MSAKKIATILIHCLQGARREGSLSTDRLHLPPLHGPVLGRAGSSCKGHLFQLNLFFIKLFEMEA